MRRTSTCRKAVVVVVAAMGVLAGQAGRAAEHVVLDTNAAAYEAGQILADQAVVTLAVNEFLAAISEEGADVRIEGPFEGTLESAPPADVDLGAVLAELVGGPREALDALGGIRGDNDANGAEAAADTRPSPWLVHSGVTGDQCVIGGRPAELWREADAPAGRIEITVVASGQSARIEWAAAEQHAAWPASLPPDETAVYLIRPVAELRSTAVRLHALNPALAEPSLATVAWMAAKGCVTQARLLLATL